MITLFMFLFIFYSFVFGLIIGSFANVFILRYGTGRGLKGRSACAVCGVQLSWQELIPVLSYLFQKGRCRTCATRISPHYAIVELVFGIVFACGAWAVWAWEGVVPLFAPHLAISLGYVWTISFLLLSIAFYDLKHLIIPNGMVYALMIVAVIGDILMLYSTGEWTMWLFIAGPLVAAPLFFLWFVSRGRWMGLGDVKLALAMGWLLGLAGGISALVFGVWIGALVSVGWIGISRLVSHQSRLTMKSMIPFGPFLVMGTLFVLLTGITMQVFIL